MSNLKTKYDIIHETTVRANDLVDARGVDKCVMIINIIQNLNELDRMLHEEEQRNDATVESLTKQLDKYKEADGDADADPE